MTHELSDARLTQEDVDRTMSETLHDLLELVRIPSIAWPGFDPGEVRRSADAVAALADGIGLFDQVSIERSPVRGGEPGQPAVVARRRARPGRPSVLLYAHHDVQPAGGAAEWDSPPFEPVIRGGRLYGRGAADDKAGLMVHIAALRTVCTLMGGVPDIGITLFVEGEEEYGSPSFTDFLAEHAEVLRSDVIVVADSANWDSSTPAVTTSLRGGIRLTLRLRTLEHSSHSGLFGGAVPDALMAAVILLSSLWETDGSVAVPGLVTRERDTPAYDDARLRREAGIVDAVSAIGHGAILSRIWNQPAITITGIDAPSVREASNTLTPEVAVAITVRTAPGQRAQDAYDRLSRHLREHAPFGVQVELSDVGLIEPFQVDGEGWALDLLRDSLTAGFGTPPIEMGVGGSIPFISELAAAFPDAQILITGIEDPETRAHGVNESLHLETFRRAIVSEALFLQSLSRGVG